MEVIAERPVVSIIVPVYNVEPYLRRCVDSILAQSLTEFELILINDGSTDGSAAICNEYARDDDRIKVIHKENSGPAACRDIGIKCARGEYLGFVDSDDYVEPSMYEQLYNAAQYHHSQMVICNYIMHSGDNTKVVCHALSSDIPIGRYDIESVVLRNYASGDTNCLASVWNKLYRKDFIQSSGITFDVTRNYGEDWWFNFQLLTQYDSISALDAPLYHYEISHGGLSYLHYRDDFFNLLLDGHKKTLTVMSKCPLSDEEYQKLHLYFFWRVMRQIDRIMQCCTNGNLRHTLIRAALTDTNVQDSCKSVLGMLSGVNKLIATAVCHRRYQIAFALFQYKSSKCPEYFCLIGRAFNKVCRILRLERN